MLDDRAGLLGDRDERRPAAPARASDAASGRGPRPPPRRRRRGRRSAGSTGRTRCRSSAWRRSASVCSRSSIRARISLSNSSTRPRPDGLRAVQRGVGVAHRVRGRVAAARARPRRRWRRAASAPGRPAPAAAARPAPAPPREPSAPRRRRRTRRRRPGRSCRPGAAPRSAARAAATSSASPVEWPYESFTSLNRSRSMKSTPTSVPSRSARSSASVQPVEQQRAVRDARQRVVHRLVPDRLLRLGRARSRGADDVRHRLRGTAGRPT